MFPFIRIQDHGNTTIIMNTVDYIENTTHNLCTKYA